uniref:Uncharacterized protein n=1 Tax=Anguilla anguilla TaxID=7936 RepID=A0A0E9T2H8_ANGAN
MDFCSSSAKKLAPYCKKKQAISQTLY